MNRFYLLAIILLTTPVFVLGQEKKPCSWRETDIECQRLIALCVESEIAKTEDTDFLNLPDNDYLRYMAEYMGIDPQAEDVKEQVKAWIVDPTNQGTPICPGDDEDYEVVEEWFVTRALHVANSDAIKILFHPGYLGLPLDIKDAQGNDILTILENFLENEHDMEEDTRGDIMRVRDCIKAAVESDDPNKLKVWVSSVCNITS